MAAVCGTASAPSNRTGRRAWRSAVASGPRSLARPGPPSSGPSGSGRFPSGSFAGSAAGAPSSISAITGPGGAVTARRTACAADRPAWSPPIVSAALATGPASASWSSRWWLTRSASVARTVSAITTRGSRSRAACAIPLTALASPGPRVTSTAPGVPVRSALVAAMMAAAVSVWVRTKRSPAVSAAPTTSRFGPPPGTPNKTRVPALARAATIAVAPAGPPAGVRGPLSVAGRALTGCSHRSPGNRPAPASAAGRSSGPGGSG